MWVADLRPTKRGSLEEGLLRLGARLRARGLRVLLCLSEPAPRAYQALFAEAGIELGVVDFRRSGRALLDLGAVLIRHRPTVIHFHFVRPHSPLVWLARGTGAQVLVHDHLALRIDRGLRGRLKRWTGRVGPRRVAVSQMVARTVVEAEGAMEVSVVDNGVPLERFRPVEGQRESARRALALPLARFVVGCVARLEAEKGIDLVVRAAARCAGRPIVLVAGQGSLAEALRALAEACGVELRLVGLCSTPEQVFAASDLVVVPSRCEEAFGLAAAEALACGRPVVVTRRGALPEVVKGAGIVVEPESHAALAAAIDALFADPARLEQLSRRGAAMAALRFDLDRWVQQLEALYGLPTHDRAPPRSEARS